MKTEKETTAEIASDVRTATRERAEAEMAEEKALRRELAKEERAKLKVRKERLSIFYYGLSTLFMTSVGVPMLFKPDQAVNWYGVIGGTILTVFFAFMGNRELKY